MLPAENEFDMNYYQQKEKHSKFHIITEEPELPDSNPVLNPIEISQGLSYHERKSKLILQSRFLQERLSACMRNLNSQSEKGKKTGSKICSLIPNGTWAHIPFDWLAMMTSLLNVINRAIQENDISIINELQESHKFLYSQLVSLIPSEDDNDLTLSLPINLKHPEHYVNTITSLNVRKTPTEMFKNANTLSSLMSSDEFKAEEWYIPQSTSIGPYLSDKKVQPFHELIEFMMSLPRNTKNFRTYKDLKMESANDDQSESLSVKTLITSEKVSLKNESYRGLLRQRSDRRDSSNDAETTMAMSDSFDDSDYSEFDAKYINSFGKEDGGSDDTFEFAEAVIFETKTQRRSTKKFGKSLNDRTTSFTGIFSQGLHPFGFKAKKSSLKSIYSSDRLSKNTITHSSKVMKVNIKLGDSEPTHSVNYTYVENIKKQREGRKISLARKRSENEKHWENKEAKNEVVNENKSIVDMKFKKREFSYHEVVGKLNEEPEIKGNLNISLYHGKKSEEKDNLETSSLSFKELNNIKTMEKINLHKKYSGHIERMEKKLEEKKLREKNIKTSKLNEKMVENKDEWKEGNEIYITVSKIGERIKNSKKYGMAKDGEIITPIFIYDQNKTKLVKEVIGEEMNKNLYKGEIREDEENIEAINPSIFIDEDLEKGIQLLVPTDETNTETGRTVQMIKRMTKRDIVSDRKIIQNPLNRKPWTTRRDCFRIVFQHTTREKRFVSVNDDNSTSYRKKLLKKRYKIFRKDLKIVTERTDSFQHFLKIIPECRLRKRKIYHLIYPKIVRPTIELRLPEIVLSKIDMCGIRDHLNKFYRLSKNSIKSHYHY